MNESARQKTIAVLISGGGTTLKNLIDWAEQGRLVPKIACVISSRLDAKGLDYARAAELPTHVVDWKSSRNMSELNRQLFEILDAHVVDLVVAGGFLKRLIIPPGYQQRVINIHPSLIPSFCGHGFYGLKVHEAVLDFGCKVSGCTVHFVDDEFDHGPIIAQGSVPVLDDDSPASLAARVFALECRIYPETINRLLTENYRVIGRRVLFDAPPT